MRRLDAYWMQQSCGAILDMMTNSPGDCPKEKSLCPREKYRPSGPVRKRARLDLPHLRDVRRGPRFGFGAEFAPNFMGEWNDLEGS